tara:strand:+ start:43 stop:441 length:399 start_codon:yes stop_codon:yes gene_type:complete
MSWQCYCELTSDGIPTRSSIKSIAAATGTDGTVLVVSNGDIREGIRVGVEEGVQKTKGTLPSLNALIVDQGDETSDNGSGARSSGHASVLAVLDYFHINTSSSDIGVSATILIIEAAGREVDTGVEIAIHST